MKIQNKKGSKDKKAGKKMIKKIGVILADSQEYAPFINYFSAYNSEKMKLGGNDAAKFIIADGEKSLEIIAVHCGIGKVNAANAAAALIYSCGVDTILNAGLSGAVSKVKRGDIVVGKEYIECDFDMRAIGYKLGEKPDEDFIRRADETLFDIALNLNGYDIKEAVLGTGDVFLTDPVRKNEYKDTFGITAFDMETAAIGAVCFKNDIAFLSVRKISDDADDASAEDYREMNNRQEVVLSQILFEIIKQMCR